ncbi:AAA family ATPase [Paenibacillus alba]|nr:AAA family ATPase [Paenibacillus alba]
MKLKHDDGKSSNNSFSSSAVFSPSSGLVMREPTTVVSPKDKANNFDLFELFYPNIKDDSIVLSNQIQDKVSSILNEYSQKQRLIDLGLPFENRLLLCGPPGCGKTSTAYVIAKQLGLPLAYVRLDSLISSLLGQTGANLRKIFESVNGKEVVLFLDEFDAIAKARDDKHELGELKRVVNTLLQNIDMLSNDVFLIAATNHQNLLDPAVWRRFNTVLSLELPDNNMRSKFIRNKLQAFKENMPIDDIDVEKVVDYTSGLNFSEIEELLLKTLKKAVFHESKSLTTEDFAKSIIEVTLMYNNNFQNIDISKIRKLREKGLTLKSISELLNIPRTTLSDWLKKEEVENG